MIFGSKLEAWWAIFNLLSLHHNLVLDLQIKPLQIFIHSLIVDVGVIMWAVRPKPIQYIQWRKFSFNAYFALIMPIFTSYTSSLMLCHRQFDENSILIIKILILWHFPHILEILDGKFKTYIGYEIAEIFRIRENNYVYIHNITLIWNYSSWIFGNPRII